MSHQTDQEPPLELHQATPPYAVVHLVAQEALKDLIASQVIDHMHMQRWISSPMGPSVVAVALLEPMRMAWRSSLRRRVKDLRLRAPGVRLRVIPYVSRLGIDRNATMITRWVRRVSNDLPVVFHCRAESAVEWAVALQKRLPGSAIVADIRGAWPEEYLFALGFDGPDHAGAEAVTNYQHALTRLENAVDASDVVFAVSETLLDWLASLAVERDRTLCVPCCVKEVRFDAGDRASARRELALDDKLVFAYAGSMTRYQHLEDGLAAFMVAARCEDPMVHLLCVTPETTSMRKLLVRAGVPTDAMTLVSAPQDEVARYLCAADAGLLLRASSRMNRVSMPVKLAEYLACGLPVVVSRMDGWVDQIVSGAGAGLAIDWFGADPERQRSEAGSVIHALRQHGPAWREGALQLCRSSFLWRRYVEPVRLKYLFALERQRPKHRMHLSCSMLTC